MQAAIANTSAAHLLVGSAAMHCGTAVRVMRNILPHPPLQAGVVWVNWHWWTCHSNFIDSFMTFYVSQLPCL